ncbi:hypothetical protein BN381_70103 [Candidatus Microthrix parvicella RN1]|uniref:Uncharacterized protein n=1 Tax=Candidatus Neomicrothrix parvicella RN1 TaxID=1229780 RepID=R4Z3B1_9ACTN|nr:hypothetical protein BN381_70103 [Candidatus Microthrix parvicella RN1]
MPVEQWEITHPLSGSVKGLLRAHRNSWGLGYEGNSPTIHTQSMRHHWSHCKTLKGILPKIA